MTRQVVMIILLLTSASAWATACGQTVPSPTPGEKSTTPTVGVSTGATRQPTLSEILSDVRNGVVAIKTPAETGSGFIISADGLVLTNTHVVGSFHRATVAIHGLGIVDILSATAEVVGINEDADVALLSLGAGRNYPHLELGDSDLIDLANDVIVLGYPLTDILGESLTVTRGIVSSKRELGGLEIIQTDAAVNPGNSGGPLLDYSGKVIGLITARLADFEGVGFAIAINSVREVLVGLREEIARTAVTNTSYAGRVLNVTYNIAAEMTLTLTQEGDVLTGDVEVLSPLEGGGPIVGTVNGQRLDFTANYLLAGTSYTLSFTGAFLPDGSLGGTYTLEPAAEHGSWIVYPK